MSSRLSQLIGGAMALVGVAILAFAVYSYIDLRRTEDALEAQIPGQTVGRTPTAILLIPSFGSGEDAAAPLSSQPSAKLADQGTATPTAISLSPGGASNANSLPVGIPNSSATATPISLMPLTPPPGDSSELGRRADLATRVPTPTRFPTAAPGTAPPQIPTIRPVEQMVEGVPRGSGAAATRLIIPKLNMDLPIRPSNYITYEFKGQLLSDWDIPYDAAGHLITTAQPGENGNAILSGHHNLVALNTFGLGAFAGLWNLADGDEVRVETEDSRIQIWRVMQSFPVKEGGEPLSVRMENAKYIMSDTTGPRLTLLTCWNGQEHPLSGNMYRWVITAELVSTK